MVVSEFPHYLVHHKGRTPFYRDAQIYNSKTQWKFPERFCEEPVRTNAHWNSEYRLQCIGFDHWASEKHVYKCVSYKLSKFSSAVHSGFIDSHKMFIFIRFLFWEIGDAICDIKKKKFKKQ